MLDFPSVVTVVKFLSMHNAGCELDFFMICVPDWLIN